MPLKTQRLVIASTIGLMLVVWFPLWLWLRRRHPELAQAMGPDMLPLDRRWLQSGWAALAIAFVYMAAENALLVASVGRGARIAAIVAPLVPLVWFVVAWRREVQKGDELDRRIHLEALSVAFPGFVVMMVGWDLLSQVHWPTPPLQLRWPFMPILYGLWVWILKFHYSTRGFGGPVAGGER